MPIGISYHSTANKPDNFPGIVGLGWSLEAGGSITRVVRGLPDYEDYATGDLVPALFNPTGDADWSSTTKLNSFLSSGYMTQNDVSNPGRVLFQF